MAEFLVKAVSATNADPEKDRRRYKRGDIVCCMPDGHEWGSEETLPTFIIVKVPGLDPKLYDALIVQEEKSSVLTYPLSGEPVKLRRRLRRLNETILAQAVNGVITVTLNQARQNVVNKATGKNLSQGG